MFPKLDVSSKKKKQRDYEEYEDDYEDDYEVEEEETEDGEEGKETIRPRLSTFIPKNKTASLPVVR